MDSDKTLEIKEEEMMKELGEMLPEGIDIGVTSTEEALKPVRGYRYYVDISSRKIMLLDKPPSTRRKKK
ncbi:MAG: hypothetical protein ACW99U_11090 [Candidatus Thorarchaeota archaeon]